MELVLLQSKFLAKRLRNSKNRLHTETGLEAIERLRFLASFPLPGTGKREGGEKIQPFNRFASHPVIILSGKLAYLCIIHYTTVTMKQRNRTDWDVGWMAVGKDIALDSP